MGIEVQLIHKHFDCLVIVLGKYEVYVVVWGGGEYAVVRSPETDYPLPIIPYTDKTGQKWVYWAKHNSIYRTKVEAKTKLTDLPALPLAVSGGAVEEVVSGRHFIRDAFIYGKYLAWKTIEGWRVRDIEASESVSPNNVELPFSLDEVQLRHGIASVVHGEGERLYWRIDGSDRTLFVSGVSYYGTWNKGVWVADGNRVVFYKDEDVIEGVVDLDDEFVVDADCIDVPIVSVGTGEIYAKLQGDVKKVGDKALCAHILGDCVVYIMYRQLQVLPVAALLPNMG